MATFEQAGELKYQFGFNDKDTGAQIADVTTIASDIGVSPTSLTINYEPEFEAQATGPGGTVESTVIGPRMGNFSMEGFALCKAKLLENTFFWFDSQLFSVSNRELGYQNQDFQTATLSGKTYCNVTIYSVGTVDASEAKGDPDLTQAALKKKGAAYLVTVAGTMSGLTGAIASEALHVGDYVHWDGSAWTFTHSPCDS